MKKMILRPGVIICLFSLSTILSAQNVGVGTQTPDSKFQIEGDTQSAIPVLQVNAHFVGLADVPAIQATSRIADGWGFGGVFEGGYMGLFANADAGAYTGTSYGVYGLSSGTAGTRIGIYGFAGGGVENWAGYFDGRGYFLDHLELDNTLTVKNLLEAKQNLTVQDTIFSKDVQTGFPFQSMRIEAGQNLLLKIDKEADANYTAAFRILNGDNEDVFGADENGNARTYGTHYIDNLLGIGTTAPASKLHVQDGSIRIQGDFPFHIFNTTAPGLPCGIQFTENGSLEGSLIYEANNNTLNLTNNYFNQGLVLDLDDNSVRIGGPFSANGYKLSVDGKIMGEELRIMNSANWPDFVFEEDYPLMTLQELDQSIKELGHLPGIPSAEEIEENGIDVGEMQKVLVQKIEELTLHILQQEKRIKELEEKQ
jgi:hypothetical protein